jgi:hypothetical protein
VLRQPIDKRGQPGEFHVYSLRQVGQVRQVA